MRINVCGLLLMCGLCLNGCDSQSLEIVDNDGPYVISVHLNEAELSEIDISDLSDKIVEMSVSQNSVRAVSVSDIITSATDLTVQDLADYRCDYESKDGFRPSSKGDRCPPVSCSETMRSFLDVQTHELFYSEDAPMVNGCYRVEELAVIILSDEE